MHLPRIRITYRDNDIYHDNMVYGVRNKLKKKVELRSHLGVSLTRFLFFFPGIDLF